MSLATRVGVGVNASTLYRVANLQNNGPVEFDNQTNPHLQGPRIPCADSHAGYLFQGYEKAVRVGIYSVAKGPS
jgi:hypothetical protein